VHVHRQRILEPSFRQLERPVHEHLTDRGEAVASLLSLLLSHANELGCTQAWVATEPENTAARALYAKAGGQEDPEPVVTYTFPLQAKP
jgi:RimJ/RimL family protein N-acetyltransferase